MLKMLNTILLLVYLVGSGLAEFHYQEQDKWPKEPGSKCGGRTQSPINFMRCIPTSIGSIKFSGYGTNAAFSVTNNGHTVEITPKIKNMKISGGNLVGEYILQQFHFHWGVNDSVGSEHAINGRKYPLEVHLVHKKGNEIAVVGYLFHLANVDNIALKPVLELVNKAKAKSSVGEAMFVLNKILPQSNSFYRYTGSLTTPPCTEGVIWSVSRTTIPISKAQMVTFHQNSIKYNWRYLQPDNNRRVLC